MFDNKTFKESDIDFYVAVTNLQTAQAEYVKLIDPFGANGGAASHFRYALCFSSG